MRDPLALTTRERASLVWAWSLLRAVRDYAFVLSTPLWLALMTRAELGHEKMFFGSLALLCLALGAFGLMGGRRG